MATDRTYASHGIHIEKFDEDDAECHSCGDIGRPRILVHLGHLCQHFVAFCPGCWKQFFKIISLHQAPRKEN